MSGRLRPHQEEALYQAQRNVPRGILSMCPRSGKTRVMCELSMSWLQSPGNRVAFVLVPTLPLLQQFFTQDWNPLMMGRRAVRLLKAYFLGSMSAKHCGFGVARLHTAEDVAQTCSQEEAIIFVSTFQSAHKIFDQLDALVMNASFLFIIDEAHLFVDTFALEGACITKRSRGMIDQIHKHTEDAFVNDQVVVPHETHQRQHQARFFTGTPVVTRSDSYLMVEEDLGYVMNNTMKFGPTLFEWSYKDALEEASLCSFRVCGLDTALPPEDIAANLRLVYQKNTCRLFPLVEAIDFAFQKYALNHLLVYVQSSQEAHDLQQFLLEHSRLNIRDTQRDETIVFLGAVYTGTPNSDHSLSQGLKERQHMINSFRRATRGILINIQILSIGISLPEVDSILLTSETQNESLIRQRVFRALQKDPNQPEKVATIILPTLVVQVDENTSTTVSFEQEQRVLRHMQNEPTNACLKLRGNQSTRSTRSRLEANEEMQRELRKEFHLHTEMTKFLAAMPLPLVAHCHKMIDSVADLINLLKSKSIQDWEGLQTLKGELITWKTISKPLESFGGEWMCWNHVFRMGSVWRKMDVDNEWENSNPDEVRHALLAHIYRALQEVVRELPTPLRIQSDKDYKRKVRSWLRDAMKDQHKYELVKDLPFYPEVLFAPIGFSWPIFLGSEMSSTTGLPMQESHARVLSQNISNNRSILDPSDIMHTVDTTKQYLEHKHNGKWINFYTFDPALEHELQNVFQTDIAIAALKNMSQLRHHCVLVKLCGIANIKITKKDFNLGYERTITSVMNKTLADHARPLLHNPDVANLLHRVYEFVDNETRYTYGT